VLGESEKNQGEKPITVEIRTVVKS